jgi:hypothetical protein
MESRLSGGELLLAVSPQGFGHILFEACAVRPWRFPFPRGQSVGRPCWASGYKQVGRWNFTTSNCAVTIGLGPLAVLKMGDATTCDRLGTAVFLTAADSIGEGP